MRTLSKSLFAAAAVIGAGYAAASDDGGMQRLLSGQEIKDVTSGKTFHYLYHGKHRGDEQHSPDGKAVWRLPDGTCYHGVWLVEGPVLCYYYGSFRYGCWNVVEEAGQYSHVPLDLDGKPTGGEPVVIDGVSEEPVGCTPQQLS